MRLKNILAIFSAALLLLAVGGHALAHGEEKHGNHEKAKQSESKHDDHGAAEGQITVRGEVLDMACYVAHEATGPGHAACAKRCVKGGQPMGLLAEDGTVYLLYANHKDGSAFEQTKEFAGQGVEIVGIASTQAGFKGLEVSSVKKL